MACAPHLTKRDAPAKPAIFSLMSDTTLHHLALPREDETPSPRPAPKRDWPLIGDILTARMGDPDLLRFWPAPDSDE